jgi:hypothetical protein
MGNDPWLICRSRTCLVALPGPWVENWWSQSYVSSRQVFHIVGPRLVWRLVEFYSGTGNSGLGTSRIVGNCGTWPWIHCFLQKIATDKSVSCSVCFTIYQFVVSSGHSCFLDLVHCVYTPYILYERRTSLVHTQMSHMLTSGNRYICLYRHLADNHRHIISKHPGCIQSRNILTLVHPRRCRLYRPLSYFAHFSSTSTWVM